MIGLRVSVRSFARPVQIEKESIRGAAFDIVTEGWTADYGDPFDFLNVLLSGAAIHPYNSYNVAYYDNPLYNKRMASAARLVGASRYRAYGVLDTEMMRNDPPWVPLYNYSARRLFSKRVGCVIFNPVYGVDLASLCLR